MRCSVAVLAVLLFVSAGLLAAEAGDCLRVWVDARGQAAECKAVDVQAELSHHPKVCPAASAAEAVVKIRLTSCREQVAAAVAPPGSPVAGREFVVRAQASEGEAVKELAGLNGGSWAGAARDLCRAIAVWHENVGKSH